VVKVRIGYSPGQLALADGLEAFAALVDGLEAHGFDSLWVPEVITGASLDPLTALSFTAGRTTRLKLGTHLVVPGRQPVRLAKELATLDQLSRGRLLLMFVIGLGQEPEVSTYGVPAGERTGRLDETLLLVRRFWSGETVDHTGRYFTYRGVAVEPRPLQQPLEVWLGGMSPSALRRCGRLADGWMPGFVTVGPAAAAKAVIEAAAEQAGRRIDPEHFGMNVLYRRGPLDDAARSRLAGRFPTLDGAAIEAAVADVATPGRLDDVLADYVAAGFSKFVLRPAHTVADWGDELATLSEQALSWHRREGSGR
jgi:probable F420-dependent oxidoreductase